MVRKFYDMDMDRPSVAQPTKHPFEKAIEELINKMSMEDETDTPDYILAQYLLTCYNAYKNAVNARDKLFGVDMWAADKLSK